MPQEIIFSAESLVEAWSAAATSLSRGTPPTFIVVSAGNQFEATGAEIRVLDACARNNGAERPSAVAEVLFPKIVEVTEGTTEEKVSAGWRLFGRGRRAKIRFSGWSHTYFERLTGHSIKRDGSLQVIKENRLQSVVEKIRSWDRDVEAALYIHTDASTDRLRPRGAPCLQYVQFRLFDRDKLELFALYRAHDYQNKALGNMIGLQRLGRFVATASNRNYSRQTVFSLHPFIGGSREQLSNLIEEIGSE
jgi:hypothetical protein